MCITRDKQSAFAYLPKFRALLQHLVYENQNPTPQRMTVYNL